MTLASLSETGRNQRLGETLLRVLNVNRVPRVVAQYWDRCGTRAPGAHGRTELDGSIRPELPVTRCWDQPQTGPAQTGPAQIGPAQMDRDDACLDDSGSDDSCRDDWGLAPDCLAQFGQVLLGLHFRSMVRSVLLAMGKRHQPPEVIVGPIASRER